MAGLKKSEQVFQILKVASDADSATRYRSALDLESENVPRQLKCPVCVQVPLEEIYQCPNGHFVCKTCCKDLCSQCGSRMALTNGGSLIRCRALEELLDVLTFACPFRKNGCRLQSLGRGNVKAHLENCVYDGNCMQLCHHLRLEEKCEFWARITKPLELVEHLRNDHKAISRDGPVTSIKIADFSKWFSKIITALKPIQHGRMVYIKTANGHFLVAFLINQADRTLSFVGLRIDKPEQEMKCEIELRIDSTTRGMPNLEWKIPAIFVLDSTMMLEQPAIRVLVSVLEKYYLTSDGSLKIKLAVEQIVKPESNNKRKSSSIV